MASLRLRHRWRSRHGQGFTLDRAMDAAGAVARRVRVRRIPDRTGQPGRRQRHLSRAGARRRAFPRPGPGRTAAARVAPGGEGTRGCGYGTGTGPAKHRVAQANTTSAREAFDNWIATRHATARPDQDEELIARNRELDKLVAAERTALAAVEAQEQVALDARQAEQKADAAYEALLQPAREAAYEARCGRPQGVPDPPRRDPAAAAGGGRAVQVQAQRHLLAVHMGLHPLRPVRLLRRARALFPSYGGYVR